MFVYADNAATTSVSKTALDAMMPYLTEKYGKELVPPGKPIPAQLLGNMWAQQWGSIYDVVKPKNVVDPGYDLTERLFKEESR